MLPPSPGAVYADRFEIDREAGRGGMGVVYRARDRTTGALVALKVLRADGELDRKRFERESAVLAELAHPALVRYVAHGQASESGPWLAMEWIEGEPLSEVLPLGPMEIADVVELGRRAAEALGAAHARGILHRDVKPSNLVLEAGRAAGVRLLDFGVARRRAERSSLTMAGMAVGTIAYMAPEQARGASDLDARADVYSLAVVLYECLSGKRAFRADGTTAMLAKILLEERPRIRAVRPEVSPALEDLIARAMSADRERRPSDGAAFADELAQVLGTDEAAAATVAAARPAVSNDELRVTWVLVLAPDADTTTSTGDATLGGAVDAHAKLRPLVAAYGGQLQTLVDGSAVATFDAVRASHGAGDRAARAALALVAGSPELRVALAMGATLVGSPEPYGEVIDRASEVLAQTPPGRIGVSARAARSLEDRFSIGATPGGGLRLEGPRTSGSLESSVPKRAPFVGRHMELAALQAALDESESGAARPVVVVGAPGVGKTRLADELVTRALTRARQPRVLLSRARLLAARSMYGVVADLLRRAAGVRVGEVAERASARVHALVSTALEGRAPGPEHVGGQLAELARVALDRSAPRALAAPEDALLAHEARVRAFLAWLKAELSKGPVICVLDDAHLADGASLALFDAALAELEEQPFTVVALGRPELDDSSPGLWSDRNAYRLQLGPLSAVASERLASAILGENGGLGRARAVVTRAMGNPLFLEELARVACTDDTWRLPDTLLELVQHRLARLSPSTRRVLRAASVFGAGFDEPDVRALLGDELPGDALGAELSTLVREELIARSTAGDHASFAFSSAVVRDVAYGMLPDAERPFAHRLAAEAMVARGDDSFAAIAEHFERSTEPSRATTWLLRAAERALETGDGPAVRDLARRGLAVAPDRELTGRLELLLATALNWEGGWQAAAEAGARAVTAFAPGSAERLQAHGEYLSALARLGRFEEIAAALPDVLAPPRDDSARDAQIAALCRAHSAETLAGHLASSRQILDAIDRLCRALTAQSAVVRSWKHFAHALDAHFDGNLPSAVHHSELARDAARELGDQARACIRSNNAALARVHLADFVVAEKMLRETLAEAERLGIETVRAQTACYLAYLLSSCGRVEEARAVADDTLSRGRRLEPRLRGFLNLVLAREDLAAGDPSRGLARAWRASEILVPMPVYRAEALAVMARAELARGNDAAALSLARRALELVGDLRFAGTVSLTVLEALAAALWANGAEQEARTELGRAVRLVERMADWIADDGDRARFLEQAPEAKLVLALAARLGRPSIRAGRGEN